MKFHCENTLIILAAGRGTRLTDPAIKHKALTPFDGEPLLQRVIKQFYTSGVYNSIVVVGHESALVTQHARTALSDISIIHNNLYHVDKNIYSLSLALASLQEGNGAIIVEGDVVFTDEAVKEFVSLCSSGVNLWATSGLFQKWQKGAIVKVDSRGQIDEIRYASWSDELSGWYRDLGLRFLSSEYISLYRKLLHNYISISMDEYFWTPWQDNLSILPTRHVDLGFNGGGTFNTCDELEKVRKRFFS